jgi:hypothetical protein
MVGSTPQAANSTGGSSKSALKDDGAGMMDGSNTAAFFSSLSPRP